MANVKGATAISAIFSYDPAKIAILAEYNFRKPFAPVFGAKNMPSNADAELFASMDARGYRGAPIIVRVGNGKVELVAGHRRLACMLALRARDAGTDAAKRWAVIPCMPEDAGTTDTMRDADQITSNSGVEFDPAEQGGVYARMKSRGMKAADIAAQFGKTRKWVEECMRAATLDTRILELVKAKVISATLALETVAKLGNTAQTAEVIKTAAARGKGANAGRATGATIAAVTGLPAKNARTDRLVQNAARHAETAARQPATSPRVSSASSILSVVKGPFVLGKMDDDCTIFDASGVVLAELASAEIAKAVLMLINQGWQTFNGKPLVEPVPVPVKPVASVAAVVAATKTGKVKTGKGATRH